MTIAMRTSVAISSGGISAQLIRLLPPVGCPGEAVWVPSNEVLAFGDHLRARAMPWGSSMTRTRAQKMPTPQLNARS